MYNKLINSLCLISMLAVTVLVMGLGSCSGAGAEAGTEAGHFNGVAAQPLKAAPGKALAAFAEGCFWHGEIIFESLQGVDSVISGYAGGKTKNPSYEDVSTGNTGHAESVLVYYDPKKLSYNQLLNAFFLSHDPTQLNEQLPDEGTQYRSVAFYSNALEKAELATAMNTAQQAAGSKKIETQVLPLTVFYRAEAYHQKYIAHNPSNPYVQSVSIPEYLDFRKIYKGPLKPEEKFN